MLLGSSWTLGIEPRTYRLVEEHPCQYTTLPLNREQHNKNNNNQDYKDSSHIKCDNSNNDSKNEEINHTLKCPYFGFSAF